MPKRFFELYDDVYVARRWHLSNPTDSDGREIADSWQFRRGAPVDVEGRLKMPVGHAGRPLDFTLAGLSIPVVHSRVAAIFAKLAANDVQLIPVDIPRQPEQYFILVAKRLVRCIDETASKVLFWTAEDGRPEKIGKYFSISDLRIDKTKVGDAKVFRPDGWAGTLIISENIKNALERAGATGVKFEEV